MVSYLLLAVAIVAYAIGIVAQATAVRRDEARPGADLALLTRVLADRTYLIGLAAQVVGFAAAFLARAELPLFLVQATTAAAVGLAAIMAYFVLGWRLHMIDVGATVMLAGGLGLLVAAAEPSAPRQPGPAAAVGLAAALAVTLGVAAGLHRLPVRCRAVVAGAMSGLAFGVLAVAARPLATSAWNDMLTGPWLWLTVLGALVGQALLAAGFKQGSPTAVAVSMEATTVSLGALAGFLVLGDAVVPGRASWVGAGLILVLGTVWVLARAGGTAVLSNSGTANASRNRSVVRDVRPSWLLDAD